MPTYDNFKMIEGKWIKLYDVEPEVLPHLCPPPTGKPVLINIFVDVNLMTDLTTGRYQTSIINILNKTPI